MLIFTEMMKMLGNIPVEIDIEEKKICKYKLTIIDQFSKYRDYKDRKRY